MQDSIRIDTGVKRILINDGPDFIELNPDDVVFVEKFYAVIKDFEVKLAEYQARAAVLDANKTVDAMGIPNNVPGGLEMLREICLFIRDKIDELFGAGTSQKLFGDALNVNMFEQFFSGITPFVQSSRRAKVEKYAPPVVSKKRKRKTVMQ